MTPSDLIFNGQRGLHFVNYNIHTLLGKIDDARIMIGDSKADCFSITESWLIAMNRDTDIMVDRYNTCRLDPVLRVAEVAWLLT